MTVTIEEALSLQGPVLKERAESLEDFHSLATVYLAFRYNYLKSDISAMQELIHQSGKSFDGAPVWFRCLLELRLAIRSKELPPLEINSVAEAFSEICDPAWRGEAFMVLAMFYEDRQDEQEAATFYQKSAAAFSAAGYRRKNLIARFNKQGALSRIEPQKKYFFELRSFADEAVQIQCYDLAGAALANLSRECQLVGAIELALQHGEDALHYLRTHDFGSLQYYLTVAHCLNLVLQTGKWAEGIPLYEELIVSPFKETQEIKQVVDNYLNRRDHCEPYLHLPATWRERMVEFYSRLPVDLTAKEKQLMEALTEGPLSIVEITERLYGSKIDHSSAIARTKQIIHRLRKKSPELLKLSGGRYGLV